LMNGCIGKKMRERLKRLTLITGTNRGLNGARKSVKTPGGYGTTTKDENEN